MVDRHIKNKNSKIDSSFKQKKKEQEKEKRDR